MNKPNNSKSAHSRKDNLIYLLALLLCLGIHFYWSLPTYIQSIKSEVTVGKILRLNEYSLRYSYFNKNDSTNYELSRDINQQEFKALKGKDKVKVFYIKYYPSNVVIEGVDKKKPILLPIVVHLFFLLGIIKLVRDLLKGKIEHQVTTPKAH